MRAKNLFGILFLFLCTIGFVSCAKEEWDLGGKETESSTVVEGTIISTDGMPLADIVVKVDYQENKWLQYSKTIHKAETKTDKNGKYRLHFMIKDNEMETDGDKKNDISKSYSLIFDLKRLNQKEYILPGDMVPTIISVNPPIAKPTDNLQPEIRYGYYQFKRSETYTENLYIPEKRYIRVTLKGFVPLQQDGNYDYFEVDSAFPYGGEYTSDILFPGTNYGYGKIEELFVLYAEGEQTFEVPVALNENNIIKLVRRKNGSFTTEEHQLFVTKDSPESLSYQY